MSPNTFGRNRSKIFKILKHGKSPKLSRIAGISAEFPENQWNETPLYKAKGKLIFLSKYFTHSRDM
jgi:hypothetical protein